MSHCLIRSRVVPITRYTHHEVDLNLVPFTQNYLTTEFDGRVRFANNTLYIDRKTFPGFTHHCDIIAVNPITKEVIDIQDVISNSTRKYVLIHEENSSEQHRSSAPIKATVIRYREQSIAWKGHELAYENVPNLDNRIRFFHRGFIGGASRSVITESQIQTDKIARLWLTSANTFIISIPPRFYIVDAGSKDRCSRAAEISPLETINVRMAVPVKVCPPRV